MLLFNVIICGKFCIILTFFLYSIKSFHFNMISITLKKLFTFRVYNRQPLAQVWAINFFFSFISIIFESLEYIINIRAIEPIQWGLKSELSLSLSLLFHWDRTTCKNNIQQSAIISFTYFKNNTNALNIFLKIILKLPTG